MNSNMNAVYTAIIGFSVLLMPFATAQNTSTSTKVETFTSPNNRTSNNNIDSRSLRLSVTVDNPEYLQVKQKDRVTKGQIIADNINERARLDLQRKSLALQLDNLKKKEISKPFQPKSTPATAPIPPAQFLEDESNIAQARLKLQQAQTVLSSRRSILQTDNPEKRASMEKVEAQLRGAQDKVREQEELLKSMQDMRLEAPVIRHEEAKLKALQTEAEQLQSALQREQALISAAGTQQQQELQNLEIAVQLATSELQVAMSRLETAKNNRKLIEHQASVSAVQRVEEENRTKQVYSQQLAQYQQQVRDKEYQLTQLRMQLSSIEDKLAQIPILRAPRDGYIRRVKPWVGNNGKYTTVLTISSSNSSEFTDDKSGESTSTKTTAGAKKQ